jgi:biotin carboxyl carrier protein
MATDVAAGLTATVWKLEKASGDQVQEGEVIAVLESMKMEIPVEAPVAGCCRLLVEEGDAVTESTVVAVIE